MLRLKTDTHPHPHIYTHVRPHEATAGHGVLEVEQVQKYPIAALHLEFVRA